MKATIYSHATIIGTADLEVGDEGMGCVFGQFVPNDYYFTYIQQFVWEFWSAKRPDYKRWESLRFNALLDNGFFPLPMGGYTFEDLPHFSNEPIRIDIAGIDLALLSYTRNTLLEPWSTIDIAQKIFVEDVLMKAMRPARSLFSLFSADTNVAHVLAGAEVSALASCGQNDEVLFAIRKRDVQSQFATVRMKRRSIRKEHSKTLPATQFYRDFDDFVKKRMIPDNTEWNVLKHE